MHVNRIVAPQFYSDYLAFRGLDPTQVTSKDLERNDIPPYAEVFGQSGRTFVATVDVGRAFPDAAFPVVAYTQEGPATKAKTGSQKSIGVSHYRLVKRTDPHYMVIDHLPALKTIPRVITFQAVPKTASKAGKAPDDKEQLVKNIHSGFSVSFTLHAVVPT